MSWLSDLWDDIEEAFRAVKIDGINAARTVAGNGVRQIAGIPLVTPYDQLPQAPTPEPRAETSLDVLRDEDVRFLFEQLEEDLTLYLSAIGYGLRRTETGRTDARQQWLWGIGREYQAPGRSGIVTDIRYARFDKHGKLVAVDYAYPALDGAADKATLLSVLAQVAELHPEMRTAFPLSSGDRDYHHWEMRGA